MTSSDHLSDAESPTSIRLGDVKRVQLRFTSAGDGHKSSTPDESPPDRSP